MNLAEGQILLAPELVVPVLRLLPQVSKSFFQLRFIFGDAVDDWTHVGKRVWWSDPVMSGAGQRPDGRTLQSETHALKGGGSNTSTGITAQTKSTHSCELVNNGCGLQKQKAKL